MANILWHNTRVQHTRQLSLCTAAGAHRAHTHHGTKKTEWMLLLATVFLADRFFFLLSVFGINLISCVRVRVVCAIIHFINLDLCEMWVPGLRAVHYTLFAYDFDYTYVLNDAGMRPTTTSIQFYLNLPRFACESIKLIWFSGLRQNERARDHFHTFATRFMRSMRIMK